MRVRMAVWALLLMAGGVANAQRDVLLVVVNRAEEQASIFRLANRQLALVKKLPIGKTGREVCISPDGNRAYVTNQDGNSITALDLNALTVAATFTAPETAGPDGCLVSANNRTLFVTSTSTNSVVLVNTDTGAVTRVIPTGLGAPRRLAYSWDKQKLYVGHNAGFQFNYIYLPTMKVSEPITVGGEARGGLDITPDGRTLFIGNVEDDTVSWVDTGSDKVVRTVGVPISPQRIIVRPDGRAAYVLTRMGIQDAGVFVMPIFDKHDASKFVPTARGPWGLAMTPDASLLIVSSTSEHVLQIIDTATLKVISTVPGGKDPNGIAIRP